MQKRYDVIVIGSGSGLEISAEAAERGLKVAVIDEGPFGGTCLNRGCIPSKMLIHVADIAETITSSEKFGIKSKLESIDWNFIQKRTWHDIDEESREVEKGNKASKNITVYKKRAEFIGKKILKLSNEEITADKIFVAAGTRPSIPPISGLEKVQYYTSDNIMRIKQQPKSLAILGGGYIAAELGHFFSALGTKTTIIEHGALLVKNEDQEIAKAFTEIMKIKCDIMLNATVTKATQKGNHIELTVNQNKKTKTITADTLLVSTGRIPNTDILKVEKGGIKLDKRGFIQVNEYMETNVPGIWALGDIAGKFMFKHSANLEASYAAHNAFNPKSKVKINYLAMPRAIFTSPQIAGVGMTEQELVAKKIPYLHGFYSYYDTAMGKSLEDKEGFVKVLLDPKTLKILGCHIMGSQASTLIHEVVVAMRAGLGRQGITKAIHVHPALPEVVQRAFFNIHAHGHGHEHKH